MEKMQEKVIENNTGQSKQKHIKRKKHQKEATQAQNPQIWSSEHMPQNIIQRCTNRSIFAITNLNNGEIKRIAYTHMNEVEKSIVKVG